MKKSILINAIAVIFALQFISWPRLSRRMAFTHKIACKMMYPAIFSRYDGTRSATREASRLKETNGIDRIITKESVTDAIITGTTKKDVLYAIRSSGWQSNGRNRQKSVWEPVAPMISNSPGPTSTGGL